jgi:hypothetical protein
MLTVRVEVDVCVDIEREVCSGAARRWAMLAWHLCKYTSPHAIGLYMLAAPTSSGADGEWHACAVARALSSAIFFT